MSTIQQNLVGTLAGLTRVEKVLRYAFLALAIGLAIYSVAGTFFGRDSRVSDYGLATCAMVLASFAPGYSRPIPGAHRALRACEWAVMGAALVCTAAVVAGDVMDGGTQPAPFNMPTNVALGAEFFALCFFTVLLVSKERARRRGLIPPRG